MTNRTSLGKRRVVAAICLLPAVGAAIAVPLAVNRLSQPQSASKIAPALEMHPKPVTVSTNISAPNPQTGGQFNLSNNVIAGGGGTSSGDGQFTITGTIGQATAGTTFGGGQFTVTGGFWPSVATALSPPTPTPTPTSTPTPTPTPNPQPYILVEEGTANRAVALDSVTHVRGPFSILTDHNFSADHHTRLIIFTSYLGLTQPDPSILTVQAAGFPLLVENVGTLTGTPVLNASFIVVRLPDGLPSGDLPLTVTLRGVASINSPLLGISP